MNARQLQLIMQVLRDVAEAHPKDEIAVACARLAHRLESPEPDPLSDLDRSLIVFSQKWLTKNPQFASV